MPGIAPALQGGTVQTILVPSVFSLFLSRCFFIPGSERSEGEGEAPQAMPAEGALSPNNCPADRPGRRPGMQVNPKLFPSEE